jgi:hypothetical protein
MQRPMPCAPPVTTATLSLKKFIAINSIFLAKVLIFFVNGENKKRHKGHEAFAAAIVNITLSKSPTI